MEKVLNLTYASSLTNLCEINSSFDTGVLRVAYPGDNRNGNAISKESFERCIKTMYNCPLVCNYDRESDTLGGHDVDIAKNGDGELYLVNLTTPVGCVPESAKYWWADVQEEDGTVHEYLHVEVLVWKRQEAYRKLKKDGIVAHSMEILVKDGEMVDGVYQIYDFEFTAFTLIGVEPCFESSALTMFSKQEFKNKMSVMMQDLKDSFNQVNTSKEVGNKILQNYSTEGGKRDLDEKLALAKQYEIDIESLDFSIEELSIEELTEKFESMKAASEPAGEPVAEPANEPTNEPISEPTSEPSGEFALVGNVVDEICRVLGEVKIEREWGECYRYWYVDCDLEAEEVYYWDTNDWLLYGSKFIKDGDSISIDFATSKRKKFVIEDFDNGEEQGSPIEQLFSHFESKITEFKSLESKFASATETINSQDEEIKSLREYKEEKERAAVEQERNNMFAKFTDLNGNEAFEALKTDCANYSVDELEEKCFAIRGRNTVVTAENYSIKTPKLKIEDDNNTSTEPYGGVFVKYGD